MRGNDRDDPELAGLLLQHRRNVGACLMGCFQVLDGHSRIRPGVDVELVRRAGAKKNACQFSLCLSWESPPHTIFSPLS